MDARQEVDLAGCGRMSRSRSTPRRRHHLLRLDREASTLTADRRWHRHASTEAARGKPCSLTVQRIRPVRRGAGRTAKAAGMMG